MKKSEEPILQDFFSDIRDEARPLDERHKEEIAALEARGKEEMPKKERGTICAPQGKRRIKAVALSSAAVAVAAVLLRVFSFGPLGKQIGGGPIGGNSGIDSSDGSDVVGEQNLNGMTIKNFSSYKALGAAKATKNATAGRKAASRGEITAKADEGDGAKLVGVKESGEVEEVEFVDEAGDVEKQALSLTEFGSGENFTVVTYSHDYSGEIETFSLGDRMGCQVCRYIADAQGNTSSGPEKLRLETAENYMIDNKSGKIFDMKAIAEELIDDEYKWEASRSEKAEGKVWSVLDLYATFDKYMEYDEYAYVRIKIDEVEIYPEEVRVTLPDENEEKLEEEYSGIYRMTVEDGTLRLEKVLSLQNYLKFFDVESMEINDSIAVCTDRYGNLYSNIGDPKDSFILKRDGSVSFVNEAERIIFKALNDVVYCVKVTELDGNRIAEECKYFNASGDLADSEFIPPQPEYYYGWKTEESYYGNKFLSIGNTDYYYWSSRITKFTFSDTDETFTRQDIDLEDFTENSVFANKKIYFFTNGSLFYCDIDTGKKTGLVSDYLFKTLTVGVDGKLYFTGLASNLDDVYGVINADDTVEIDIKPVENNFEIIYVAPLN